MKVTVAKSSALAEPIGTSLKPYSLATLRWFLWVRFFVGMRIRINGEEKEIGDGLSLAQLLEELRLRPGRIVVELNRDIVSREAHASTFLKAGDVLEIVHFVGGG